MAMDAPRSVFSVLFIVCFSVDVAELTCKSLLIKAEFIQILKIKQIIEKAAATFNEQ